MSNNIPFLPIEIRNIILSYHYKNLYTLVLSQLKEEKKSVFDNITKRLVKRIAESKRGAFQKGHFDEKGKNHSICVIDFGWKVTNFIYIGERGLHFAIEYRTGLDDHWEGF